MSPVEPTTLKRTLPNDVRTLCSRLEEAGYRAWIVGGCVRDALLADLKGGTEQKQDVFSVRNDWDIATNARPEQVRRLFPHVIPTGIQHGTVTVMMGATGYEVTTLRGETTYSDGRRPDAVHFVDDVAADLARRDFTINAIAYDPRTEELIDPSGGLNDLRARRLKAVGEPRHRFAEDGLRVLRAARFVATLELELDPDTERAIEPSLASYRKVSAERIREEWLKSMKARRPSLAFEIMRRHGMLAITAPDLLDLVGCDQGRQHAYDVWEHTMRCLDACPPSTVLRTAALLHDIGKPRTRTSNEGTNDYTFDRHDEVGAELAGPLLERLRFSGEERRRIVALVRHHIVRYEDSWSGADVRRWIRAVTPELLDDIFALRRADIRAKGVDPAPELGRLGNLERRVSHQLERGIPLDVRDLAIGGQDLMKVLRLRPGPLFGDILRQLLDEVVDDPAKNVPEVLLARAREIAERRGP